MSRKNQRRLNGATTDPVRVPVMAPPVKPAPAQSGWRSWVLATVRSQLGGVVAILISILGIWYTHHQTHINEQGLEEVKRQNDLTEYSLFRASGEIPAKIEYATYWPSPRDFGKDLRIAAFGGTERPYYKDVATFLKVKPTLILNNVGEEPIEAIRIGTSLVSFPEVDLPWQPDRIEDFGLVLREEEREDIVLPQLWLPDTSVQISLAKGILAQMLEIEGKENPNAMRKVAMQVRASGKIAGSTVFSKGDQRVIMFHVWWMPNGFPEAKCREVLDAYQSKVNFGPKRPVSIGRLENYGGPTDASKQK